MVVAHILPRSETVTLVAANRDRFGMGAMTDATGRSTHGLKPLRAAKVNSQPSRGDRQS